MRSEDIGCGIVLVQETETFKLRKHIAVAFEEMENITISLH